MREERLELEAGEGTEGEMAQSREWQPTRPTTGDYTLFQQRIINCSLESCGLECAFLLELKTL